ARLRSPPRRRADASNRAAAPPRGRTARRADRESPYEMTPLLIFLLACTGVYLGAIEAAFSALMRLSLRLAAERSDRPGALSTYLDDPVLLFIPVRVLLGVVTAAVTALLADQVGVGGVRAVTFVIVSVAAFVILCELLLPWLIVNRNPERALDLLLPSFGPVARALAPVTRAIARMVPDSKRQAPPSATPDEAADEANEAAKAY